MDAVLNVEFPAEKLGELEVFLKRGDFFLHKGLERSTSAHVLS